MSNGMTPGESAVLDLRLSHLAQGLDEVKSTLGAVNKTLQSLVRVEGVLEQHAIDLQHAHERLIEHDSRLRPLERDIPVLKETRGWVVAGVLAVFAFFGYLVIGTTLGVKPFAMPIQKVAP